MTGNGCISFYQSSMNKNYHQKLRLVFWSFRSRSKSCGLISCQVMAHMKKVYDGSKLLTCTGKTAVPSQWRRAFDWFEFRSFGNNASWQLYFETSVTFMMRFTPLSEQNKSYHVTNTLIHSGRLIQRKF